MANRIPHDAIVVRGGRNLPEDLERGTGIHPSGIRGVSVECNVGVTVAELADELPHRRIGVTTVRAVRAEGGDVLRTTGRSPRHATLTGLDAEAASRLLTPTVPNPMRRT